ncbi:2TM domain-containing protein [Oceanihabitans sp. 2_MG-2023]|uniref:2TM domain-containing protein n=1 Tax=Oceanihabitans sp. 2_MG-2023 TaxID=3062661 RepID=UPI0026E45612|nr:2TM domain-containing protein [Oceanihabitans sp. 2_MG-2023]MDO6597100.1 2TM domain-containing protein [Oceanihabitans sp. 2_MG-2023]
MDSNHLNNERIAHARKQVKRIKGFYTHLMIYIVINIMLVFINIKNLDPGESYFQFRNFITFGTWGIAIIIHALSVFLPNFVFGSKWEEQKIKKFMEQEKKFQNWD